MSLGWTIFWSIGAGVSGQFLTDSLSASVYGRVKKYQTKAVDPSSNRIRYYDGTVVENVKTTNNKTGGYNYNTYYDGYYPQFISKHDTAVAYWIRCDFWDSGDVYSWS